MCYNVRKGQSQAGRHASAALAQREACLSIWRAKRARKTGGFAQLCPKKERSERGKPKVLRSYARRKGRKGIAMRELTELIRADMRPALGVTEPGAIAFAVASAKSHVAGEVKKVRVALNSGMYKNAFTCGIPNSSHFGNLYAAALGAVAADAKKGLESLDAVTPKDDVLAEQMVADGKVEVVLDHIGSEITIDARVETETDNCVVSIRGSHTNIVQIVKNGICIWQMKEDAKEEEKEEPEKVAGAFAGADCKGTGAGSDIPVIHRYTLAQILSYVQEVPAEEIAFIGDAFTMNLELLQEGIRSKRTMITPMLLEENGQELISENAQSTAQLLCNGAIEARVLGLSRPAMSITGSGAHGIIATMPLYAYAKVHKERVSEEALLRATVLSYLITMYIKEYSGKLSAFCGCGIAAGTGMACGLAYLQGAEEEAFTNVIQNMASGLTGMICDGGNHGCAMKGIVAVDAAFRAADMAKKGICIEHIHGINGRTPEDTMRYMGMIASPGMVETEKTIVEIMEQK